MSSKQTDGKKIASYGMLVGGILFIIAGLIGSEIQTTYIAVGAMFIAIGGTFRATSGSSDETTD